MSKILYFDTETTGLEEKQHSIFQIASIIEIDGRIRFRQSYMCQPVKGRLVSPEALEINHMTMEKLRTLPDMKYTFDSFCKDTAQFLRPNDPKDRFMLSGYNAGFDVKFLIEWFKSVVHPAVFYKYFWVGNIDIMGFCMWKYREERDTFADFKLQTVAKRLGVNVDEAKTHEGLYDIELTYNMKQSLFNLPQIDFSTIPVGEVIK